MRARGLLLAGKHTEAASILTHLPDRPEQSADYLRGSPAAPCRSSSASITGGLRGRSKRAANRRREIAEHLVAHETAVPFDLASVEVHHSAANHSGAGDRPADGRLVLNPMTGVEEVRSHIQQAILPGGSAP